MNEGDSELQQAIDRDMSHVELQQKDSFSQEIRDLALSLVMQIPSTPQTAYAASSESCLTVGDKATIRLAGLEDMKTICEFRCAQSIECQGLSATEESYRLFCTETEAYVCRNLNTQVYFAFVERAGEVISMSGLEVVDKLPAVGSSGGVERGATVVACYTLPQHRGKGYMRQMLSTWATLAPLLGIDAVYLESHIPSMQMLALDEGYDYVSEKYQLDLVAGGQAQSAARLETPTTASVSEYLPVG